VKLIPLFILFFFIPSATDVSMAGLKINGPESSLKTIGLKEIAVGGGLHKFQTANGNELAVTIKSGKIVYIENDWKEGNTGSAPLISSFEFGKTSLKDIRDRLGCNGFSYKSRMYIKTASDLVMCNCFELNTPTGEVFAVFTRIPLTAKVTADNLATTAKLVGVLLARKDFLNQIWGEQKLYDPTVKKVDVSKL